MREFDAFAGYPEPKEPRIVSATHRTIHNRIAASARDKEFYDGDRRNGYGGMVDDGRWKPIAANIVKSYGLGTNSHVLQVGAHKGFLLNELHKLGIRITGTETSDYAISQSETKLFKCSPTELPFYDHVFDLVIAASAVYTLNLPDAIKFLKEVQRVTRGASWITLGAYEDENDIEGLMLMRYWLLLGTTVLTKADWIAVMQHAGYSGDFRYDTAKSLNLRRT